MASKPTISPLSPDQWLELFRTYPLIFDAFADMVADITELMDETHDACGCEKCHPEIHMQPWSDSGL